MGKFCFLGSKSWTRLTIYPIQALLQAKQHSFTFCDFYLAQAHNGKYLVRKEFSGEEFNVFTDDGRLIGVYTGPIDEGKMNGNGRLVYDKDGSTFTGLFHDNMLEYGQKVSPLTGKHYEGQFSNDQQKNGKEWIIAALCLKTAQYTSILLQRASSSDKSYFFLQK